MDYTAKFYSSPNHVGSGVIYSGARRQRGGSALGALKSVLLPIAKTVGPKLIKKVGKIAKRQLFGLATDLIADKVSGKNMKDSLKSHGKARLLQGATQGLKTIGNMIDPPKARRTAAKKRRPFRGSGIKKRKSSAKKRKSVTRQKSSRKRKASSYRATASKKRRVNF